MLIQDDLSNLVISVAASIREGIARMNATPHLVQLVVEEDGRLVGIITDGDVRRAIVAGADLNAPVRACMHPNPIVAHDLREALSILTTMGGRRRCVPIVDGEGRPIQVASDAPETPGLETAVVMAGGFGRRQGEQTRTTPKPLLPLAGRPMLWHVLKDLEEHGLKRVFITIHYLGEQIRAFVNTAGFRIQVDFLEEPEPLGTAGGLGLLPPDLTGPVLVMNADIVTRADFGAMMTHHRLHEYALTIGATRHDTEVPFGVLKIAEDGTVMEIQEKPLFRNFVSAGIYAIEREVYGTVRGRCDMPDLIRETIADKGRVGVFPIHEYWRDLAKPNDLQQAEEDQVQWLRR